MPRLWPARVLKKGQTARHTPSLRRGTNTMAFHVLIVNRTEAYRKRFSAPSIRRRRKFKASPHFKDGRPPGGNACEGIGHRIVLRQLSLTLAIMPMAGSGAIRLGRGHLQFVRQKNNGGLLPAPDSVA